VVFGLAFVGGWIERIGSLFGNKTAEQIGIVTSLIMPSEVLWQLAAYRMQLPLLTQLGLSPFASASEPSGLMSPGPSASSPWCLRLRCGSSTSGICRAS